MIDLCSLNLLLPPTSEQQIAGMPYNLQDKIRNECTVAIFIYKGGMESFSDNLKKPHKKFDEAC